MEQQPAQQTWIERLELYNLDRYGTCFHCEKALGPDDKGNSHSQCWDVIGSHP